jgi:hypothetical protein
MKAMVLKLNPPFGNTARKGLSGTAALGEKQLHSYPTRAGERIISSSRVDQNSLRQELITRSSCLVGQVR